MAKPSKTSKFFKTLLTVLLLAIIVITVAINVAFYKSSSAPFNSVYVMQQTDMNDVQYGDAVIASPSKVSEVKAGNVVLCLTSFDDEYKEVLKVIDITQEDGTTYYYVRSDQQSNDEALKLTQDKILAKCLWTNSSLGAIINFAKSNLGIIILIGIPCVILLILKISSAIAEQKEAQKEEELRKKAKKKAKKEKAQAQTDAPKTETPDDTTATSNKPKQSNTPTKIDADEFFSKSTNKTIPVKQLSEEESIQQRENVSKATATTNNYMNKEITREFKNGELVVSPINHVNAVKIDDDSNRIVEEDVHSPNMNEKANQIRRNLSNSLDNDNAPTTPTPVVVPVIAEKPVEVAQEPIQEVTPETPQEPTISTSDSLENAVVIIPETPKEDNANTTPTIAEPETIAPQDDDIFKDIVGETTTLSDDELLNDIIGESNEKSSGASVSDDFLDQLLNSIPSSHTTETVSKPSTVATPKKTTVERPKKTVKHHKVVSKAVDNTSFDELIQAIEREKNGIK
jgi:hypothetical protein